MAIFSEIISFFINYIWTGLGSFPFLLLVTSISFVVKAVILVLLVKNGSKDSRSILPRLLLLLVVIGSLLEDFSWILKLIQLLFFPALNYQSSSSFYSIILFFIRLAWGCVILRDQSMAFLLEHLSEKKPHLKVRHVCFLFVSTISFLFFVGLAFFCFSARPAIEFNVLSFMTVYSFGPLTIFSFSITLWRLRFSILPKLIKKQLKVLLYYLVLPFVVINIIQALPFNFSPSFVTSSFSVVGLSTVIMTYAIYYTARKIMGLRFLNFYGQVMDKKQFEFIDDFKSVIEQFASVTSVRELEYITKKFFKDAFFIPVHKTHVYIRLVGQLEERMPYHLEQVYKDLELFTGLHSDFFMQEKMLIADELSFNHFYRDNQQCEAALTLLNNIGADVVIPVYNKNICVGYIVVESDARIATNKEFYGNVERDQMLIFATYLGNIIHLLNTKNIDAIIAQEKELREELYSKHQKINQYQESIRSFIKNEKERKIGIIFYKNRQFVFGNQTAQELMQINPNMHVGDPLTKAITKVTHQALAYKTQQTALAHDHNGRKIVLTAIPNVEGKGAIIATHYPEISDVLKGRISVLDDPSKWDYLLYLETTKSGKLINKLVPGSSETMLRFKIDLLKAALSKKAILLDVPEEDSRVTAELLHKLSLRETLHVLTLHELTGSAVMGVQLFGANPLLGMEKTHGRPLLEKLDGIGTLFIQNIHFLDKETQESLAGFLRYGFYTLYKTDQRKTSDVRIICSTNRDLAMMVQEGLFSENLFKELSKTKLVMPSLFLLPEQDVQELADEVIQQTIQDNDMGHLFELTNREKRAITQAQPASMQELKKRIHQILEKKSRESGQVASVSYTAGTDFFELDEALRLGKNALKDKEIMTMLWQKFKNQNKIALFLGVNRSSVNRRCKEYNLDS